MVHLPHGAGLPGGAQCTHCIYFLEVRMCRQVVAWCIQHLAQDSPETRDAFCAMSSSSRFRSQQCGMMGPPMELGMTYHSCRCTGRWWRGANSTWRTTPGRRATRCPMFPSLKMACAGRWWHGAYSTWRRTPRRRGTRCGRPARSRRSWARSEARRRRAAAPHGPSAALPQTALPTAPPSGTLLSVPLSRIP